MVNAQRIGSGGCGRISIPQPPSCANLTCDATMQNKFSGGWCPGHWLHRRSTHYVLWVMGPLDPPTPYKLCRLGPHALRVSGDRAMGPPQLCGRTHTHSHTACGMTHKNYAVRPPNRGTNRASLVDWKSSHLDIDLRSIRASQRRRRRRATSFFRAVRRVHSACAVRCGPA